jgi:replicative DNA helicase
MTAPKDAGDVLRADGQLKAEGDPIQLPSEEVVARAGGSMRPLSDALEEALERMDARAERRELPIVTPWSDFNEQLPGGGFWPGCHVLVSGTGAGKSTWALQLALHAAQQGTPVIYAGLELEDSQIALRLAGELASRSGSAERLGWSKLYTGMALPSERERAREAAKALEGLPFYLESGDPMGWCATRLRDAAAEVASKHEAKGALIVVDFLQLIGAEPDAGRQDLRERIGRAAYFARDVAKQNKATVLLISSVARNYYADLSSGEALKAAGLGFDATKSAAVCRFLKAPDSIVGMGKESGEIEYAADSVTVAISVPRDESTSQGRTVVFATAKMRAGPPGWCSLKFDGQGFSDDDTQGKRVMEWLASEKKTKGGKEAAPPASTNGHSARDKPKFRSVTDDDN